MANWYTTEFRLTGSQADREAAMALLNELYNDKDRVVELSDLADALGCNPEKTFARGHIEDFREREDHIELCTETANQPPYQVIYALCRKYPSLKYYFKTELNDEILTNDVEKKFFHPEVKIYLEHDGKELCGEFYDYDEALQWANGIFSTGFDSDSYLTSYVQSFVENSYCQFVFTRVIGEDEQLTIIPDYEDGRLDLYTLDGTHAGTVT